MADENSSVVSIVGILAIVVLVGIGIYFFLIAGNGDDPDLRIDIEVPGSSTLQATPDLARAAPPVPVGVRVLA